MDERTIEQVKADEDFESAIKDICVAYGYTEGMIVDWVFVFAQHIVNDDGTTSTLTPHFIRPGQPKYRTMGLLDHTLTRGRADAAGNLDVEEL